MVKAVVLGASGGIGQPLSLLFKASPLIDELALYDVVNTPGVAADLSHINTDSTVVGYLPAEDGLQKTLTGADIVVIPAGIPRKPGMTRDDLFKINAGIVRDLVTGVAKFSPKAFVLVISNPVNSTVPIAAEVLKQHNVFDPTRLFGVTSLDVVRASTFVSQVLGDNTPTKYTVPVIGGHSGETIVPLLSQTVPEISIPDEKYEALVKRIQFGGDEVVTAKSGTGSATLSMAYAGFRFAESLLKASSKSGITEPTYVYLPGVAGGKDVQKSIQELQGSDEEIDFFAVPVELGANGAVKAINPFTASTPLTSSETALLGPCFEQLKTNIKKGVEFINTPSN